MDVLTNHNDNGRTGANLDETLLTTTNVRPGSFGRLFTRPVRGEIYAQPLFVAGVSVQGHGARNVVYVATTSNKVYAFDAEELSANSPYWVADLGPSDPRRRVLISDKLSIHQFITEEIGIIGTPVISLRHHAIYVVSVEKKNESIPEEDVHKLHALDLSTGQEKFSGPVPVGLGVPDFKSAIQLQRPGLLLSNDRVYVAFGSYGDEHPDMYHGWVFAYEAGTLEPVWRSQTRSRRREPVFFNTTKRRKGGGIWQSGLALAGDENGFVYFMTGNDFTSMGDPRDNSAPTPDDLGDCFVKLTPNLELDGWFSPHNNLYLRHKDLDLGSGGVMLIPNSPLLIGGGKEGKLYVLDRGAMRKYGYDALNDDNQIVQRFQVTGEPRRINGQTHDPPPPASYSDGTRNIHGGPVYWEGPTGPRVYIWGEADWLRAFRLARTLPSQPPVQVRFVKEPVDMSDLLVTTPCRSMPGAILSLSANKRFPGTGILWASHVRGDGLDAVWHTRPGILRAFDASNLSNELWNSSLVPSDHLRSFAKFCPPTVANGRVYMATFSEELVVYGLLRRPIDPTAGHGSQDK